MRQSFNVEYHGMDRKRNRHNFEAVEGKNRIMIYVKDFGGSVAILDEMPGKDLEESIDIIKKCLSSDSNFSERVARAFLTWRWQDDSVQSIAFDHKKVRITISNEL